MMVFMPSFIVHNSLRLTSKTPQLSNYNNRHNYQVKPVDVIFWLLEVIVLMYLNKLQSAVLLLLIIMLSGCDSDALNNPNRNQSLTVIYRL